MATNETKEPTLTEIKNEVIKQAQHSRISMWVTIAAFGGSVVLFGASQWAQLGTAIPIAVIGFGFMIWALCMASKRQREFRTKWNKPPRF
jgi:fatty acid desaturase